jgi:hypothetical protein
VFHESSPCSTRRRLRIQLPSSNRAALPTAPLNRGVEDRRVLSCGFDRTPPLREKLQLEPEGRRAAAESRSAVRSCSAIRGARATPDRPRPPRSDRPRPQRGTCCSAAPARLCPRQSPSRPCAARVPPTRRAAGKPRAHVASDETTPEQSLRAEESARPSQIVPAAFIES